jgi:hypothetical protein
LARHIIIACLKIDNSGDVVVGEAEVQSRAALSRRQNVG